ncbi:MAG: hypothetical protein ABFR95_02495 [Actinomycetota bacterium]
MTDLDDYLDEMGHHEATDRDIERLFDGSVDEANEFASVAGLVAALQSEAIVDVDEATIVAYTQSTVVEAANAAQQPSADSSTERVASTPLLTGFRRRVAAVAATSALFIGSLSGVAVAADHAKPGDTLYGIDRALEAIGIGNGNTDERLVEVQALFDSGEVPRGLRLAADVVNLHRPDNADASSALLDAADRVMSGGSEQSLEARDAVAGLLSHLSKSGQEFNGPKVAEIARQIGRPDDSSAGTPPVDPGPADQGQPDLPGQSGSAPESPTPPTSKP